MIKLIDVYKSFGPKKVLEGFSLEVEEGETMVLIGYSGTGKSVAIKHIVGLLEPDRGTVWVDGKEVPKLSRNELYELRSKIGYVFRSRRSSTRLPSATTSPWAYARKAAHGAEIITRVGEALELVDLPGVESVPAAAGGAGARPRTPAIARQPKYIMYDEPTTGLDPVTSAIIDQLMIRMRERLGVTSIVVTHDMRSAYTIGSRIAMLYEGKCRQVGTVDEIQHTHDPIVKQFIEGKPDLDAVEAGV
jgi:phospholipid/cholesterol/gamma-HCH transport system ATP-binding protein